jgi:hypothetical protein
MMPPRRNSRLWSSISIVLIVSIGIIVAACSSDASNGLVFPWPTKTPRLTDPPLVGNVSFTFGFASFPATPVPSYAIARSPSGAPSSQHQSSSGANPSDAMTPDGAPHSIPPGASLWFKIGTGGERMEVFLDSDPSDGVSLSIFGPGNTSDPIGHGTVQKNSQRLQWAGGHWNGEGVWYARITNNNSTTARFTFTSSSQAIGNKSCYSYWENYPTGQRVYWTECQK